MTQWYEAVDHVTLTPGQPIGLGLTFEIIRSLPGGPVTNRVEITDYEPPSRITVESTHGPTPFRYGYTLEPIASGTLLRLDGRITTAGLPGPAAHLGPIATLAFKRGMKHNLAVLKAVIEARPPTPSHADTQVTAPPTPILVDRPTHGAHGVDGRPRADT
jgi:Polyketide cyclase / dehydrase and lipid transport